MKENKSETLWVRVSPDLKAWIEEQAAKEDRTISAWVARKLWEYRELSRKDKVLEKCEIGGCVYCGGPDRPIIGSLSEEKP